MVLQDDSGNDAADFFAPSWSALQPRYLHPTQVGCGHYSFSRLEGRAIGGLTLAVFDVRLGEQLREGSTEAADLLVQGRSRASYRVARLIVEGYG